MLPSIELIVLKTIFNKIMSIPFTVFTLFETGVKQNLFMFCYDSRHKQNVKTHQAVLDA